MRLAGKVALVTGASRGIGRGVALALGAEGASVYLTARTVKRDDGSSLETAAEAIENAGGRAFAMQCDHQNDDDVRAVVERIETQSERLDILVNNVFATPRDKVFETPFWEQPLAMWDTMHSVGLRSHYVASALAAPLMIRSAKTHGRALIANISSFGGASYQVNVAYGVGKAGVDRLARDMARELRPHNVCAVSLYPGIVRTERVLAGELPFSTEVSESPQFTGRAIAALALDDAHMAMSGKVHVVAELAQHYGFTDLDGTTPPSLRALAKNKKKTQQEESTR